MNKPTYPRTKKVVLSILSAALLSCAGLGAAKAPRAYVASPDAGARRSIEAVSGRESKAAPRSFVAESGGVGQAGGKNMA